MGESILHWIQSAKENHLGYWNTVNVGWGKFKIYIISSFTHRSKRKYSSVFEWKCEKRLSIFKNCVFLQVGKGTRKGNVSFSIYIHRLYILYILYIYNLNWSKKTKDSKQVNAFYLQKQTDFHIRWKVLSDKKRIYANKKGKKQAIGSLFSLKEAYLQFQNDLAKLQVSFYSF